MHGLDVTDLGFRSVHNARGRFDNMDPLCEQAYHTSPYAISANNPVNNVDVLGLTPMGSLEQQQLNYTVVDLRGKVKAHVNDEDHRVYLDDGAWDGTKDGLSKLGIVGFEDPKITYNVGDTYNPYFGGGEGILNPVADPLDKLELWLNSEAENGGDLLLQILVEATYGSLNSTQAVLTHNTIGGSELNSNELIMAFADIAPALFSAGLTKTKIIKMLKNSGLQGYNELSKQLDATIKKGYGWQKRVSRLYHDNTLKQDAITLLKDFAEYIGLIKVSRSKIVKK